MDLSNQVIVELSGKLKAYEAAKAKLERKIAAIREVMSGDSSPGVQGSVQVEDVAASQVKDGAQLPGLRGMLRDLLKTHPNGLKTGEITKELVAMGYSVNGGKTPLSSKVSGELYRMRKKGDVKPGPRHRHLWIGTV